MIPLIMIQNSLIDHLKKAERNAYCSGLMDGEGTICISKQQRKGSIRHRNVIYSLRISIAMASRSPQEFLKKEFGGVITTVIDKRPNHRVLFHWVIWGPKATIFLKAIYPYSLIKREQIENALEFQNHIEICKKMGYNLKGYRKKFPPEIMEYREKLFQKSKDLKKDFH